jgi:hypothetical protein
VQVKGTGPAVSVQAWLADGSQNTVQAASGVQLTNAIVYVVPQTVGQFALHARALDKWGCWWQTGVFRLVTITP